ncbi:MAG: hypothetical protein GXP09_09450 [Gammaproteobacteria bacterium]|nr:hypothetical protein [Gammaproteobacteria bacterium]
MAYHYPTPQELGIKIPANLVPERFCSGFRHGLKGGQIDKVQYLRRSFRLGYRMSKLFLREYRRQQGILTFPTKGQFRFRAS